MKKIIQRAYHKANIKSRPDYYITPTHDFTKYTRDSEHKYWSKDTRFDWNQNVAHNLKAHLENLDRNDFSKILFLVLPMVEAGLGRILFQIRSDQLPIEEDALKDIAEFVPFDKTAIQKALMIQSPLKAHQSAILKLKDQLEIYNGEFLDLREQQRLGFFKNDIQAKLLETDSEKQEQVLELSRLSCQINQVQNDLEHHKKKLKIELQDLKKEIRKELDAIEPLVIIDLEETIALIQRTLACKGLPGDTNDLSRLKDLTLKRQLRGLKDIANHALVVEQSAIAPLTMGIIHYKRHREIQEAMTTFINDEAKHSATFRRYLAEKLSAKEFISAILIKGAGRYMWIARFMPGAGLFLAVIVEVIGAATLEFFGDEKYMPDSLFCNICKTISVQDETRHMDLCVAMYNELFRKGYTWERVRNNLALKVIIKSVYGDKTDDHHLIQAFRAFGIESALLYRHVTVRLSEQLARISMYVTPERLLEIMGRR